MAQLLGSSKLLGEALSASDALDSPCRRSEESTISCSIWGFCPIWALPLCPVYLSLMAARCAGK